MWEVLWTYTPQFMSQRIKEKVLYVRLLQIKKFRPLSRSTKSELSLNKSEYKEDRKTHILHCIHAYVYMVLWILN